MSFIKPFNLYLDNTSVGSPMIFDLSSFIEIASSYVALITSFIGLVPQVYKGYVTKSMEDVSVLMLGNYLLCSVAWIIYGYSQQANIVLLSNAVGLIVSLISIMQKYYYARKI